MITETRHYQVVDGLPSRQDIVDAIEAAKKRQCTIILNWKGPGYQCNGDTYSCTISPDDDPDKIFNSLPKTYGL
jgi:hypothetical protein